MAPSDRTIAVPGLDPAFVLKWIQGWALSRGTPPPVPVQGGFRVDVGLPEQRVRYVLPRLDGSAIEAITVEEAEPFAFVKVCADRTQVARWLPPHRVLQDPAFMMTKPLGGRKAPPVPAGYEADVRREGAIVRVEIRSRDGAVAARGRMAVNGSCGIADQIATDAEHRRRRLGTLVMLTLEAEAMACGADTGILVATQSGFGLYSTMDWTVCSAYTSAVIRPAAA